MYSCYDGGVARVTGKESMPVVERGASIDSLFSILITESLPGGEHG